MQTKDLFLVALGDQRYLLYAPLRRAAAVVNSGAASVVSRYLDDSHGPFSPAEQQVIDQLLLNNLIGGEDPAAPVFPENYTLAPYEVTLFLTTRCNLRCRYCYAEGGSRASELGWDEARAAIDFVADNAARSGRNNFIVGFHGGGEPTLAWDMMVRCVEYAHERAAAAGMVANIHTATNGILSKAQRETILRRFTGINVSFDGLEEIQNHNRPFANGRGSFHRVMETLRFFDQHNFDYGIRVTVTSAGTERIPDIIRFLGSTLPALRKVHIEPLWYCGRCHTSGEIPPSPETFIDSFSLGQIAAEEMGIDLSYSGARVDSLSNCFCAAPGEGFSVIPGGIVTSCFEVCDPADPRAELFHYGAYDRGSGQFVFDQQRLLRLRGLSVDHLGFCADCFCKWHCAGDCLAKALQSFSPEGHQGSLRCGINRALTLAQLKKMILLAQPAEPISPV